MQRYNIFARSDAIINFEEEYEGEWVRYKDVAARITELEDALAAEKRLVADYAKHNAELIAECERLRGELANINMEIKRMAR